MIDDVYTLRAMKMRPHQLARVFAVHDHRVRQMSDSRLRQMVQIVAVGLVRIQVVDRPHDPVSKQSRQGQVVDKLGQEPQLRHQVFAVIHVVRPVEMQDVDLAPVLVQPRLRQRIGMPRLQLDAHLPHRPPQQPPVRIGPIQR